MKVHENEYRSIAKCNEEKDLDIILEASFSFDVHIQSCINNATKMKGTIKRTFTFLDKEIFSSLHRALNRPPSGVWYMVKRQSVNQKSTEKSHKTDKYLKEFEPHRETERA